MIKFDITSVNGVDNYEIKKDPKAKTTLYLCKGNEKAFCVLNPNTLELRTDEKLKKLLCEKYESVMESRYFGRGGIEIVLSGQLSDSDLADLVRLSYNLTKISL